jgi:hypothetical protein
MNKQDPISWKKLEQKWVSRRNLIRGAAGAALGTGLLRANSAYAGDDDDDKGCRGPRLKAIPGGGAPFKFSSLTSAGITPTYAEREWLLHSVRTRFAFALCALSLIFLAPASLAQLPPWGVQFFERALAVEGSQTYHLYQPDFYCSGAIQASPTVQCIPQTVSAPSLIVTPFDLTSSPDGHAEAIGSGNAAMGVLTATLKASASAPWGFPTQMSAASYPVQNLYWLDYITATGAPGVDTFTATLVVTSVSVCDGGGTGTLYANVLGVGLRSPLGTPTNVDCLSDTVTYQQPVKLGVGQAAQFQGQLEVIALAGGSIDAQLGGYFDPNGQSPGVTATFCLDPVNGSSYTTASGLTYQSVNGVCVGGTSPTSCQAIIDHSILSFPTLYSSTTSGGFPGITSTFTPNYGYTISQAAKICGFVDFDWVQTIVALPDPSPYFAMNLAVTPTTGHVGGQLIPLHLGGSFDPAINTGVHLTSKLAPFNDPPQGGGYSYQEKTDYSYPFYCDPTGDPACPRTLTTLGWKDSPADPCIAEPSGMPGAKYLSTPEIQAKCGYSVTKPGAKISFTTHLAGVQFDGTPKDLGIGYTWTSNFNGTSGGVATTKNASEADPGSGSGGITVVSVNEVTNYRYPKGTGSGSPSATTLLTGAQISSTASGLAYSRVSQTFDGTVTITNIISSQIDGPFQIVFDSLTTGVTLIEPTSSFGGWPYLTVPSVNSLEPGQSATVSIQFKNPSNVKINFAPVIYSGSFN